MEIGSKLRQARQRTGMTQEQVAREIHVSRQTISNWETGKSLPDVLSVIALSDLYLVSLDELLKGDANMLHHIEESTNAVKSRQRLGKWMETLSFLVIWAVCVAVFWLGGGEAGAMGYSILVLYWVLPLCTFVVSLVMGLDSSWKERQWWMLLYFGVGFMLVPYGTFSLANMVSTGTVHLPEWEYIPYGMFYAMPGMCLGSAVRWAKARKACPEDRRRPLWIFGLVWGLSAAALFSLPLIEVAALFLSMFLPFGEVAIAALRGEWEHFCLLPTAPWGAWPLSGRDGLWEGLPSGMKRSARLSEKWMCLPLFGAAFLLSAGVGALLVPFSWARSLWPLSCFFWGMLPPMLGIAAGSFAARRKSFH